MKPIKGWLHQSLTFGTSDSITIFKKRNYDLGQSVIILPLADYDQMIRDHEAQLREAAKRIAPLTLPPDVNYIPTYQPDERESSWLKYLKSIKAVTK